MRSLISPHVSSPSASSSRTIPRRSGSPVVRRTVARPSSEVAGWRISGRGACVIAAGMIQPYFQDFGNIARRRLVPAAPPPRRLPTTTAFVLVAFIIGLALYASATPTPLYGLYQAEWHFSTPVLTLIYAVYCFGVLAALLLAGRVSDEVGRRPVLAAALAGLIASAILFLLADSVAWLFAARALQGLTTGTALGAAGAALLDLHPRRDGQHASLINGVASVLGIGTGALVASLLVQYAPSPLTTPFVILLALIGATLAATVALPEPVVRRASWRVRPQTPRVPAAIRGQFALSSLGVLASWSVGGL